MAVLVVDPNSALEDDDLRSFCRERLAGYKVPKHFVRVDALPRNGAGKVLKYELRERYATAVAQSILDGLSRRLPRAPKDGRLAVVTGTPRFV